MDYIKLNKLFYKDKEKYHEVFKQRQMIKHELPLKIKDHDAFYVYDEELGNCIGQVYKLSARVEKLSEKIPPVALRQFLKKMLTDEIVLTNEIEGVASTRKEVSEAMESTSKNVRLKGMVLQYQRLLEDSNSFQLHEVQEIRDLYDRLVKDEIKKENYPDGKLFRKENVDVVTATQKVIHKGIFGEEKIITALQRVLDFMNDTSLKTSPLIKISFCHYAFGYIHPFYDGNGRISRFISSFLLKDEVSLILSLKLSSVIKENMKVYYEMFESVNDVRSKGDCTPFILQFLYFIKEAAENVEKEFLDMMEKFFMYIEGIKKIELSNFENKLMHVFVQNALYAQEGLDVKEVVKIMNQGESSVRSKIQTLEKMDLIEKDKKGKKLIYTANLKTLENYLEIQNEETHGFDE